MRLPAKGATTWNPFLNVCNCFLWVFVISTRFIISNGICHLDGYKAFCSVKFVDGVSTDVTVVVNRCHDPVDVTFIIKGENVESSLDWRHTFVATNPPETARVKGIKGHVFLHVYFSRRRGNVVGIQAYFYGDNARTYPILNGSFHVASEDDCHVDSGKAGRVTLGIVLTIFLSILCCAIVGWMCYRRKHTGERVALIDDMEVDVLSSSGLGSSDSTSSTICASDSKDSDQNCPSGRASPRLDVPK